MFQTLTILAFVITLGAVALHFFASPCRPKKAGAPIGKVQLVKLLLKPQDASLLAVLKRLLYLVAAVCFVVLGLTGFYPLLVKGEHISGYPMMIHATFAPVFAICLAMIAIVWASSHRFIAADWPWLQRLLKRVTSLSIRVEPPAGEGALLAKLTYWIVVFLSLPLILSIIASMFPFFGTHAQDFLLAVHRYTAVAFAVAAILNAYAAARAQMRA